MRSDAALAQGLNTAATKTRAAITDKWAEAPKPLISACTAPAPNTSAGTYKGKTNKDKSTSPPRTPKVRAAPTAPIKESTGVPKSKLKVKTQSALEERSNCKPKIGANKTKGKPESHQCAKILAATSKDKLLGDKAICSKLPSA